MLRLITGSSKRPSSFIYSRYSFNFIKRCFICS